MKEQEATRRKGRLDGLGRSWFPDGSLKSIWRAEDGTFKATLSWNESGKLLEKSGDITLLTDGKTIEQLHHVEGERKYLQRLRCPDDKRPQFVRLGSFGSSIYGNIVDGYQVRCAGKKHIIYMDLTFPDYIETEAVPGFHFGQ